MKETKFKRKLKEKLERELGSQYRVKEKENLIYRVIVNGNLQYEPAEPENPRRGSYAFQTDLMIVKKVKREKKEKELPLIIIEIKSGDFTTHDVLTYSTKSLKHKEIYPYIRYGLVVGGKNEIDNRFFTHNAGFDFAVAMKEIEGAAWKRLKAIIYNQLKSAELLLDIFENKKKVREFNSIIKNTTKNK